MGRVTKQLQSDRSARNAARAAFDQRLAQVRDDLEARGVGGRIADRVGESASDILDEAAILAGDNRGLLAGTIAAVAIWLLRDPIIAWIEGLLGCEEETSDD